jgi:inosose dehydratase
VSALRLGNAPVSFGVFELTAQGDFALPEPEAVLAAIAGAGYDGTELGPAGYLGDTATLRERLDRHALELVAGFVPVRFSDPAHAEADMESQLSPVLALFEAAGARAARPVLADATEDKPAPLDDAGFARLAQRVTGAAEISRARGFEPVFHHHHGSHVETPSEIEALLAATDLDLVLDTGHLLLGGGDPVRALSDWGGRIDHVHLKDVKLDVIRDATSMLDCWRRGAFCELGEGDVDLDEFLGALSASGYDGWLVVEQDRILPPGETIDEAAAAQERNRRWLARHLEPLRA